MTPLTAQRKMVRAQPDRVRWDPGFRRLTCLAMGRAVARARPCAKPLALLATLLLAAPAMAERDFCADRPGLDTPPCTIEPGRWQLEVGLIDHSRDRSDGMRDRQTLFADTLVRVGLDDATEARIGWTPFGRDVMHDLVTGERIRRGGIGDVTLSVRRNLRNPDGQGVSLAVQPSVTLPVGRTPIGAGDWGASLLLPAQVDLSDTIHVGLTPEVDAAVDEDGRGRHLAWGGAAGLTVDFARIFSIVGELAVLRDRDPDGHETQARAALSLAVSTGKDGAFDMGAVAGLNHSTPDLQLVVGYSRRF